LVEKHLKNETTAFRQLKQSTSSFKATLAFVGAMIAIISVAVSLAVTYGGDKTNLENLNVKIEEFDDVVGEIKTDFNKIIVDLKAEIVENRHKDEERDVKLNEISSNVKLLLYQVEELNKKK